MPALFIARSLRSLGASSHLESPGDHAAAGHRHRIFILHSPNSVERTMVPSRSSLAGGLLLLLAVTASAFVVVPDRSACTSRPLASSRSACTTSSRPLVSETQHIISAAAAVRQFQPLHASSSSEADAAAADASIEDDVDDDDEDDDDTVIHIKSKAMERLRELKSKQEDPSAPMILRMGVRSGGCSGMSYVMDFTTEDDVNEDDEIDEYPEDGIKCVVDAKSLLFLYGLELDYSDELIGGGFKFFNPNAEEECGCGSSFGV